MSVKVKTRWYDVAVNALCFAALLAVTLYIVIRWNRLPEHPPSHFDVRGAADGWGKSRSALLTPLIMGWVLFALLAVLELIPAVWNMPGGIRPQNVPLALRLTRTMLGIIKLSCSLFFAWAVFCAARGTGLGTWAMPLLLVGTMASPLVFLPLLFRLR